MGKADNNQPHLSEISPFIALQLRVARLEQEMSEVKKTDHSADVLASIRSQVPTAVDKYLGSKLDDALLKVLERHTADLIEKYSVLPGPETIQNQESEKSPKEIIKAKKEAILGGKQGFNILHQKSANRNTTNYHLYHALMEALIADEDAMDKEVADKVKDHKRKHDSDDDEDDDDDEGPSAGSNQGRSTKRRRSDSAASGSAQPPPKDDDQSSKKPRESGASATKQHPALTSTGWQITDTRDAGADYSMHRSDPESEHSEQSSDDIPMKDEGNDSDMEDTDNAHIPKVSTTTWFKPIPESERLLPLKPEWTHSPEQTGKKKLCKANLEGPAFNLVKAFHKNSVFLQYQMDECHKLLNKYSKPLSYLDLALKNLVPALWVVSGKRIWTFSAVLWLTTVVKEKGNSTSIKHSEPSESSVPTQFSRKAQPLPMTDMTSLHTAVYMWIRKTSDQKSYGETYAQESDEVNELQKVCDGTLTELEKLDQLLKISSVAYNKGMETRKWLEDDKRRSKDFITAIEKRL
ncbi:hypothetical protein Tco_0127671 [Tanacetum coccineum]